MNVFEAADAQEQEVPDQPMQPAKVAVEDQVKDSAFAAMILFAFHDFSHTLRQMLLVRWMVLPLILGTGNKRENRNNQN